MYKRQVLGVFVAHPAMNLPAFSGFNVGGKSLFPTLFITIACGAVSGFHSLVSSGTSSKTVSNEKDMLCVGYGSMMVESLLGVIALVVVGAAAVGGKMPEGTPFPVSYTHLDVYKRQVHGNDDNHFPCDCQIRCQSFG